MLYIKVMDGSGQIVGAEAHETPVYVRRQSNGAIVRCTWPAAQGILALDSSNNYQLEGRESLGLENGLTAAEIYGTEYEQIIQSLDPRDPEDDDPVIPDPEPGETPMTRAELTEAVKSLLSRQTDMTAKSNIYKGEYFIMHDEVYVATSPIEKGREIKPGYNCKKTTLDELKGE